MKVYLVAIIVIVILIAAGSFYFYKSWLPTKQLKIQLGLASDKFPWRDYSQAELDKMYPQIKYADIPTRVTPEQTYAKFREALKTNNLELALEQFYDGDRTGVEAISSIRQFYKENKFEELYSYYPEKIEKENMYESIASYYYITVEGGEKFQNPLAFTKNANGDWKMDSL